MRTWGVTVASGFVVACFALAAGCEEADSLTGSANVDASPGLDAPPGMGSETGPLADGGGGAETSTGNEGGTEGGPPPAGDHLYLMHASTAGPLTIDVCMRPTGQATFTDPPVLRAQGKKAVPFKAMSAPIDAPAFAKTGNVDLRIVDGAAVDCSSEIAALGTQTNESFFVNRLMIAAKGGGTGPTVAFTAPGYGTAGVDTVTHESVDDSVTMTFEPDVGGQATTVTGAPVFLGAGMTGKLKTPTGERLYKASNGGRTFTVGFTEGSILVCDIAIALVDGLTDCSDGLHKP